MVSANEYVKGQGKQPLFSFGVISDVQYADIPDGRSFLGVPWYYHHSILVLQRTVKHWNSDRKPRFCLNFGDIVDGFCPKEASLTAVKRGVKEFEIFPGQTYHMLGNHCLYNLPRETLIELLQMPSEDGHAYYYFDPSPEYRFVVLDAYDISAIGWPQNHPNTVKAMKVLQEKNPNVDKNSPMDMVGTERRFLMFDGAVGKEQLEWLERVLDSCKDGKKVIVCGHFPLDPSAACPESLCWNYDEVMDVIHRYRCVKACLVGHDHKCGYCVDLHGIHYCVFEAALECPPGRNAYGQIHAFHDRLFLAGVDRMNYTEMIFG